MKTLPNGFPNRYPDPIGCVADGSFGHAHVRDVLARELDRARCSVYHPGLWTDKCQSVYDSLCADMPDDAWDEDKALKLLQEVTAPELVWGFSDGDLLLMPEDWEGWEP